MLKLRRGVVCGTDPLVVRVGDEERPAWADAALVGEVRESGRTQSGSSDPPAGRPMPLGLETLLAPRMSSGDPRERHHGLSHHIETVLGMLLGSVRVPAPAAEEAGLGELREACGDDHEVWLREAAVDEYALSGLSARHMGRSIEEDRLFFAAALAAGDGLAAATRVEAIG